MKTASPFLPGPLERATSRTRTARAPLTGVFARQVESNVPEAPLYAGPPAAPATLIRLPGHLVDAPFAASAVQVFGTFGDRRDTRVGLLLDLAANRDVARIELYGNLLLPPVEEGGRPVHNFGLPRAVAVAVCEDIRQETDLHGLDQLQLWPGRLHDVLHPRFATRDLRALWGWTPIPLPPTYGRFLVLLFEDLPLVWPRRGRDPEVGLDVQRLVIYPFVEDVDHRPHVEYAPVASRQLAFRAPSAYWARMGVAAPDPATHQSIGLDEPGEAVLLPGGLVGLGEIGPVVGPVGVYASDLVELDGRNRVLLTVQATCDEIPLVDGLRLAFRPGPGAKAPYPGPKVPELPDYLVAVLATTDVEAAWSADPDHPGWREVAAERLVRPGFRPAVVRFEEPVWARWFQLRARLVSPPGAEPGGVGRLVLAGLDVLRSRDFWLAPEADQDIRVDHVLLRLRGPRLLEDYAYVDGEHGVGLTLEAREGGGPFEAIRSFRSLVALLESTQPRVFANYRRADKPVQRLHEVTESRTRSTTAGAVDSTGDSEAFVKPEFNNTVVTRSGALTTHTDTPRGNLGGPPFTSLPTAPSPGVKTTRTFEFDVAALPPPAVDLGAVNPGQLVQVLQDWAAQVAAQGAPVSLGLGLNFGANLGASAILQAGGNVGVAGNVGVQAGGGVTRSRVEGSQGSVVESESWTRSAYTRQQTTSHTDSRGSHTTSAHDERDVVRHDRSEEVRRTGVEVRYAGVYEDLVLVAVPLGRVLRGPRRGRAALYRGSPAPPPDVVRLRVDHLPVGVRLDVEFRGQVLPLRQDGR